MMKFFRKYTKHLLVAVVISILISWLLGSSLEAMLSPDPDADVIGSALGEKIRQRDVNQAAGEGDVLNRMGIAWSRPWGLSPLSFQRTQDRPLDPLHWMLLVREARQSGLEVSAEQFESFKALVRRNPGVIERLRNNRGLALDTIDAMVEDYLLVLENANLNIGMAFVSTPEIRTLVRDTTERLRARTLVIPAEKLVDEDEPIEESEILSIFNKYKSVLPGEGELGMGYKCPSRVRVETLSLKTADVEGVVSVSEREARDYWTQNKTQFRRPQEIEVADVEGEEASTVAPRSEFYEQFSEAKPAVVEYLRGVKARGRTEQVMSNLVQMELATEWDFRNRGNDRYPIAPESVRGADYYEKRLAAYANANPLAAPLIRVERSEPMTPEQLGELAGIGNSFFLTNDGVRHNFVSLLHSVQGLGEMPTTGESGLRSLYLARYQTTDKVLQDFAGNCYGFRVVELIPTTEPTSVEEVREQVVEDIRLARGYERAEALARRIAATAQMTSLDEAVEADIELRELLGEDVRVQEGGLSPRMWAPGLPAMVAGHGGEELIDFVFELGEQFEADQPKPVGAVGAPMKRDWLVVEVAEVQPVTEDVYEQVRNQRRIQLMQQRSQMAQADWYSYEQIDRRTGWVEKKEKSDAQ